jgi:hypothetical protein
MSDTSPTLHNNEAPFEPSYAGSGALTYPEGALEYIWDGRGMNGPGADCIVDAARIQLKPKKVIRKFFGWPEILLPVEEIDVVERLFNKRFRFRMRESLLDGACFRPTGSEAKFAAALHAAGLSISRPPWRYKAQVELRIVWNQMRWGGRKRLRETAAPDQAPSSDRGDA